MPRRHVDTVAEQVIALDHDVADIDADAEPQLAVVRQLGVTNRDFLLE